MKEHPNLINVDWRLQAATTIVEGKSPNTGKDFSEGDVVKKYIPVSFKRGTLGFGLPNPTAIFLNSSNLHYLEARNKFDSLPIKKKQRLKQDIDKDKDIFDYFEYIMGSIVLSFTAIDAFTNEYIPEDYSFEFINDTQSKILTKDEIIWLPIDTRILEILPDIFNTKFSRRKKVWIEYKKLKSLRDRIIHMRSNDLYPPVKKKIPIQQMKSYVTIWNSLITDPVFNGPKIARNLISFFLNELPSSEQPRWHKNYPY